MARAVNWLLALIVLAILNVAFLRQAAGPLASSLENLTSQGPQRRREVPGYGPLNASQVITGVLGAPQEWPDNLILALADGYKLQVVKILVNSFLQNVPPGSATLLLFTQFPPWDYKPEDYGGRVAIVEFRPPAKPALFRALASYKLRFLLYEAWLAHIRHTGKAFLVDARDVAILGDVFKAFDDETLHVFEEPATFRIEDERWNMQWMVGCYGHKSAFRFSGFPVLNAGVAAIGPTAQILRMLAAHRKEIVRNQDCVRDVHGSDQAMHMFIIYSGYLASEGVVFRMESNELGRVLHCHKAAQGSYKVKGDKVVNVVEQPFVAVHQFDRQEELRELVVRLYGEGRDNRTRTSDKADDHLSFWERWGWA